MSPSTLFHMPQTPIADLIDRLIKEVTDHPHRDELLLLTQQQLADDTIVIPSEVVQL